MLTLATLLLGLIPDGAYRQDCRNGYSREEIVSGGEAVYVERNYAELACRTVNLELRSYGRLHYGAELDAPEGVRELDFTFTKVTLAPNTEEIAALYRTRRLCGVDEWAAHAETEITGRGCDFLGVGRDVPVPPAGERRYGIVQISGDGSIRFGRLTPVRDGTHPALRPRELDDAPFRRQVEIPQ